MQRKCLLICSINVDYLLLNGFYLFIIHVLMGIFDAIVSFSGLFVELFCGCDGFFGCLMSCFVCVCSGCCCFFMFFNYYYYLNKTNMCI